MATTYPNILLIVSDQQRRDCIGYDDSFPVSTPHIDQLAREGMWFNQAFAHMPVCGPARQSLLNGRRPEAFGSLWNYGITLQIPALAPEEYAWPRDLQKVGYQTGYIGKWNVNPEHSPLAYGFEHYVSDGEYISFHRRHHPNVHYQGGYFGEVDPLPLEDSQTHWLAREAVGLLAEFAQSEKPWHLRLDFPQPHLPCRPVAQFAQLYPPQDIRPWGSFGDSLAGKPYIQHQQLLNWEVDQFSWEDWQPIVARYYGIISQMDDAIGIVLRQLKKLGADENTLVIYTADHGDLCGSHGMLDKHYVMYDDLVRVPLIMKWLGRIPSGSRCDDFVYNFLDLPPTILELIGQEQEMELSGCSLWPLLTGKQMDNWRQEVVSTYNGQQFGLYTQRMLRTKRWKYVWNATDVDELYDLQEDPWERTNLIFRSECANITQELRVRLHQQLIQNGDGIIRKPWVAKQWLNGNQVAGDNGRGMAKKEAQNTGICEHDAENR